MCYRFRALFQSILCKNSKHFLYSHPSVTNNPLLKVRGAVTEWQARKGKVKLYACVYVCVHVHICVYS